MIKNNKGFTLIEVLLAVTLLGIALIPIMQAMPGMYRINEEMIIENKLSFYAQDKLEEVKSQVISDITVSRSASSQTFPSETLYRYNVVDDGGTDINPSDSDGMDIKVITVQAWYGGAGSTFAGAKHKIELISRISYRNS